MGAGTAQRVDVLPDVHDWREIAAPRAGGEPLRFLGRRLAAVSNEADDRATWSEVDLFARQRGGYVVAVRVVRGGLAAPDLEIARLARTLEHAAEIVAAVDPASGVSAEPWPPRPPGSPGRMLAVVAHRTRIAVLRKTHAELVRRAILGWGLPAPAPAPAPAQIPAPPPRRARPPAPEAASVHRLQSLVAEEFGARDAPRAVPRRFDPLTAHAAAPAIAMLNAGASGAILAVWMAWSAWSAWAVWSATPQPGPVNHAGFAATQGHERRS